MVTGNTPKLKGLSDPPWLKLWRINQAGVAQLVEHDLAKVGVASSSLVSRSETEKVMPHLLRHLFYF
jgi:hypothetical protein